MPIAWDDSFAIGDEAIDADHRAMMALIGRLDAVTARPGNGRAVEATLSQLRDLCHAHFQREEAWHRRVGFADLTDRQIGHRMLLKRLDAVLAHFAASSDQIRAGILRTLADSLATWLHFHISRSATDLRPQHRPRRHPGRQVSHSTA